MPSSGGAAGRLFIRRGGCRLRFSIAARWRRVVTETIKKPRDAIDRCRADAVDLLIDRV